MARVIKWIDGLLATIRIDLLTEVPLLVQQPHTDERHTEIAGGLELIARHIAEAAAIDGKGFAQHELHAEVGDRAEWRVGVARSNQPGAASPAAALE